MQHSQGVHGHENYHNLKSAQRLDHSKVSWFVMVFINANFIN